jgi:hypothetical protein
MTRFVRWMTLRALLGVLLLAAPLTAQAADPMTGKWVLNVTNSMYDPGPPPKSQVRTQKVEGDTYDVSFEVTGADGATRQVQYTAKLDGSDYPITGVPNADTIAVKRIDARTLEFTAKQAGKTTTTGKHRISEDGTELEVSMKGTNEKGEEFNDLAVFDKR